MTPGLRRSAVTWAIRERGYSQRRACKLVGIEPKTCRYVSRRPDDGAVRARLRALAAERRRFGYRRLKKRDGPPMSAWPEVPSAGPCNSASAVVDLDLADEPADPAGKPQVSEDSPHIGEILRRRALRVESELGGMKERVGHRVTLWADGKSTQ